MKLQIILGSTREGRIGDKVAKWVLAQTKDLPDIDVELLDLRDWELPFYDEVASPSALKGDYKSEVAKKWAKRVDNADAYVIVTPEYNHSFSAVLKNALDYAYREWHNKPALIVGYSVYPGAGVRAAIQLRPVLSALGMFVLPAAINIPSVPKTIDENYMIAEDRFNKQLSNAINKMQILSKALSE